MKFKRIVKKLLVSTTLLLLLSGCTGINLVSTFTTPPTLGYTTSVHDDLVSLPEPMGKISVAVYGFRDQSGQYKTQANATSFSTAVTQGATSMLVQALIDSKWFVPVEREELQNLLTERKITRAAKKNGTTPDSEGGEAQSDIPSLIPAHLLIEGGVVAYESNIITGGFGAKYFGAGGNVDYRTDRVTIYLRAVDIRTGRILKSVSTTKSILSKGIDIGLFRFVRLKRLLEVETGLTTNEPPQMCVLEAIEKAVQSLIIEGILDNLWTLKNTWDLNDPAIIRYQEEKSQKITHVKKNSASMKNEKAEVVKVENIDE